MNHWVLRSDPPPSLSEKYFFFAPFPYPLIQFFGILGGIFYLLFFDFLNFQNIFFYLLKKLCRVYFLNFGYIIHHLDFDILGDNFLVEKLEREYFLDICHMTPI